MVTLTAAARLTTARAATSALSRRRLSSVTDVTATPLSSNPGASGRTTAVIVTRSPGSIVPSSHSGGGPVSQLPWLTVIDSTSAGKVRRVRHPDVLGRPVAAILDDDAVL